MRTYLYFTRALLLIAGMALVPAAFSAGEGLVTDREIKPAPLVPGVTPDPALSDPVTANYGLRDAIPDWAARWELARVLSYAGKYDESIARYREVIEERPDLDRVKIELARVLFWDGKADAALSILEGIAPPKIDGPAMLLMAELYAGREKYEKAAPLFRSYLEDSPDDLEARLKLAEMLSWAKRYDESLVEYEKILKAKPDDIQVRRRYAGVLIWAGRHEQAAEELKKTLDQQ